ncbi:MAG TPA: M1 family metallopeptidase [Flavitalea sp.]|nr:M1 family metallopeptidase [Flavitalea sp.]
MQPCIAQDSLRGSITPERAWWDVLKYDITVEPDAINKSITGSNIITFKAIMPGNRMQIDLQEPMEIVEIIEKGEGRREKGEGKTKNVSFQRHKNVYYLDFKNEIKKGAVCALQIKFAGVPQEAVSPPWDGGWIWKHDKNGNPWISVACQSLGASIWYPCKDYQGDEPDSALLSIIVPDTLVAVGNGRLRNKSDAGYNKAKYSWAVTNPINNYNIIPYIGNYVHWSENYKGEKGDLTLDYWALKEDEEKAKKQFTQVPLMMKCFEYWFGPYPFYADGYKLVEAPHLGMEHQSAIAYGNKFGNGYLGKDRSGTGWGNKWDYIIVHESGHEWFGNNITTNDIADLWVHEGFTSYSETLYTECQSGKQAGYEYNIGLRRIIKNDKRITGKYGMNEEGSTDMYEKGATLVHMIREIVNDDEKFRQMLRGMNTTFYHKTVTGADIEQYINSMAGRNLSKVFDQYLRTANIPVLQYKFDNGNLAYRWSNCVEGFDMPVKIITDKDIWIYPGESWKTVPVTSSTITVNPNFYVASSKM